MRIFWLSSLFLFRRRWKWSWFSESWSNFHSPNQLHFCLWLNIKKDNLDIFFYFPPKVKMELIFGILVEFALKWYIIRYIYVKSFPLSIYAHVKTHRYLWPLKWAWFKKGKECSQNNHVIYHWNGNSTRIPKINSILACDCK